MIPQELIIDPATFNRGVTYILRSVRDFAPTNFDDVFVYSRDMNGKTDVEVHRAHTRQFLLLMRKHNLYANLKMSVFAPREMLLLWCILGKHIVRPDPEKKKEIPYWPVLVDLRDFVGFLT